MDATDARSDDHPPVGVKRRQQPSLTMLGMHRALTGQDSQCEDLGSILSVKVLGMDVQWSTGQALRMRQIRAITRTLAKEGRCNHRRVEKL